MTIEAGEYHVKTIDGITLSNYTNEWFAIVFKINSTWLVTFSGSQFDLYISKDGYSSISSTDIKYAGPFYVADLTGAPKKITIKNPYLKNGEADFYIGTYYNGTTAYSLLIGPIPFDITAEYHFIKIYDGSTTAVAVGKVPIYILPSVSLTPTEGAGGQSVTIQGVAFLPNQLVNITYTAPSSIAQPTKASIVQIKTDSSGKFTYSWNIYDLGEQLTGTGNVTNTPTQIDVAVLYNKSSYNNATSGTPITVSYNEYKRGFLEFKSLIYGETIVAGSGYYLANNSITINVYVHDKLIVAVVDFRHRQKAYD